MRTIKIIAEGELACFTRPEMKVERVSYDVPTPGAIEGMLKGIYWKPAMRYVIDRIIVFNPISFLSLKRNEVNTKLSFQNVKKKMKNKDVDISIYTGEQRMQRSTMFLKNVRYGIEFHIELTHIRDEKEAQLNNPLKKHEEIFRRRLLNGQQEKPLYFGCSECPVKKMYLVEEFDLSEISPDIANKEDEDLGYMLYRMNFHDKGIPVDGNWENPVFRDDATAVYYRPHMKGGIVDVSEYIKEAVC